MNKADWIIRIEMGNFFDRSAELRARKSKGVFKDKIYRAVFTDTLRKEFTKSEISRAVGMELIAAEKILENDVERTVYLWMEKECRHQPSWYKRVIQNLKNKFVS